VETVAPEPQTTGKLTGLNAMLAVFPVGNPAGTDKKLKEPVDELAKVIWPIRKQLFTRRRWVNSWNDGIWS